MPIPKWRIKGIVDDYDTCGCCGRRGLKRTVAMMPLDADGNEDGTAEDVVYYGTSCAADALSWTQSKVTDTARAAQAERNQRDNWARRMISIYAPVEFAPVCDKARVYYGRNQSKRDTGVKATEEVPLFLVRPRPPAGHGPRARPSGRRPAPPRHLRAGGNRGRQWERAFVFHSRVRSSAYATSRAASASTSAQTGASPT